MPEELKSALDPILDLLEEVDKQIKVLDLELERLARDVYPETQLLRAEWRQELEAWRAKHGTENAK